MNKSQYSVSVLVNGKPIQELNHQGKVYVEGRKDSEYSIRIHNNDWQRVLAVVTVDGINVITGEPAKDSSDEPGYVVPGWGSYNVKGFRKDLETVGGFKFCRKSKSYCNEVGAPGNNGVIGVQIYSEKQVVYMPAVYIKNILEIKEPMTPWYPPKTTWTKSANDNTYNDGHTNYSSSIEDQSCVCSTLGREIKCKSCIEPTSFDIGTTWGDKIHDQVSTTSFEVDCLKEEFIIYYSNRQGLENMGVPLKKEKHIGYPKAFGGFAKPPSGWIK